MPDLFHTLFPDSEEIYTLEEIATHLNKNYDQACHAQHTLSMRTATSAAVQPLDDKRPAHYSPEAARLIGRHLVRGVEREVLKRERDRRDAALLEAVLANQIVLLAMADVLTQLLKKDSPESK